jgi:hypothetical protein
MAKKAAGKGGDASPKRPKVGSAGPADRPDGSASRLYQKSSSLLDTRVVYCGDNLELTGRMQKEEGRMMKPARFPILHSSFILLNFPVAASHYVKVMPILGELTATITFN